MKFKLANIFCDNVKKSVQYPLLYCRANAPIKPLANGVKLDGQGEFDFTTYFNAVSFKKWTEYTDIDNLSLHLEIEGGKGTIVLTKADQFSFYPEEIAATKLQFDATQSTFVCDLKFPNLGADMLAFKIVSDCALKVTNSYYYTETKNINLNQVELALCTTTFKKEDYIIPNTKMIFENIINSNEQIASHFTMHIVDNGRTLKDEDIPNVKQILLYSNDNVGGSGGFARGMIEAMHQKIKATHVLLMDDDVEISPESIKRTYALLCLANKTYKNAFVSGSMIDYDFPNSQWEDLGFIDKMGKFRPIKSPLDMTCVRDCITNEIYDTSLAKYAAWWYCAIPCETIEKEGLPLPLFVRSDDTEYGFRCKPKFMTMNSICVFHKGFHYRYDAAVERYQTTRNTLIANAITGCGKKEWFLAQLQDAMIVELKKFNYKNAILALEGFEDFMKGPSFIMKKGIAEQKFIEKHKTCEQLKPIDEAILDVPKKHRDDVVKQINRSKVYEDETRSFMGKVKDYLTVNNQKAGTVYPNHKNCVVIPSEGWIYTPGRFLDAKSFFVVDFINKKATYRKKDKTKFKEIWKRYQADLKHFKKIEKELYKEYADCKEEIISEEFWRKYLGI